MKKLVVLTGAGMSAESGLRTFRDEDGLWEGHDVMRVASIQGWYEDMALVLDFYNQRRRQLLEVEPNEAHRALVKLENKYETSIITQNVDNLHERAGSSHIIHLHGELTKARSFNNEDLIVDIEGDIVIGDKAPDGGQLRPHIVWFGEPVPMLEVAAEYIIKADVVLIIGTSMQVYPAAGLIAYAHEHADIYYVDPRPNINYELSQRKNIKIIPKKATEGVVDLVHHLL